MVLRSVRDRPVGQVGCPGGFQHPVQGPGAVHPGLGRVLQFGNLQVQFLVGAERGRGDARRRREDSRAQTGRSLTTTGLTPPARMNARRAGRRDTNAGGTAWTWTRRSPSRAPTWPHTSATSSSTARSWTPGKNDLVGGVPDGGGAVRSPAFPELAHAVGDGDDAHALTGGVRQPHVQGDADDLAYLVQGEQQRRVQLARRGAGARPAWPGAARSPQSSGTAAR